MKSKFALIGVTIIVTILALGLISSTTHLQNLYRAEAGSNTTGKTGQPCIISIILKQPSGTKNITIDGQVDSNKVSVTIEQPSVTKNITIDGQVDSNTVQQLLCS